MPRRTEDIVWNVTGQTLRHRAPQGRPTSATFKVFAESMGDDGTPEFTGAATVDSVNTTVSSSSGASQSDPRRLNVASTAGVVVGRKLLVAEGQKQEWVEPLQVGTGYLLLRDRLLGDYTTAATVQSCDITAAVDAAWVADLSNLSDLSDPNPDYRVRWSIVIAGVTHIAYSFFELVRAPRVLHVDLVDLGARWPGLAEMLGRADQGDQGRSILEGAWRMVRVELAGINLNDTAVMEDERLDEAVIHAAFVVLAEAGIHPRAFAPVEYVRIKAERFDRFIEQHFKIGKGVPRAGGQDSDVERTTAQGLFIR